MSESTPFEFRPSGRIDFESIDVDALTAAKAAAEQKAAAEDDGIDRDPLSINFGRDKGARPSGLDRMLSGAAMDWFVGLAAELRPKALCERYPHVANRIAAQWAHAEAVRKSLEQLVADARWGQAGFPGQVQGELQRLLAAR